MTETLIILQLILSAKYPLSLEELSVALDFSTNPSISCLDDLDLETELDFQRRIRESCGLFIYISDYRVHLIHQTAKEFLLKRQDVLRGEWVWKGSVDEIVAQTTLARSCNRSLLQPWATVEVLSRNPLRNYIEHSRFHGRLYHSITVRLPKVSKNAASAFERYATENWMYHYRRCQGVSSKTLLEDVLELYHKWHFIPFELHCASAYGHLDVIMTFLWSDLDEHLKRRYYELPLLFAIRSNQTSAVKLLLSDGADANKSDDRALEAPLVAASKRADMTIIRLLLSQGAHVEARSMFGWTALFHGRAERQIGYCTISALIRREY